MFAWLIERLKEPSTWRGLVAILTGLGVTLQPNQAEAIIAAGLAVVGLIEVFRREKKTK